MAKLIDFSVVEADAILIESTSLQSFGYGIVSQFVTKNRNISIQAKGLHSYLVSCAGNDKQTYPSQKKMCYDLNIGNEKTLRKYITELQKEGLIKIVKTKRDNIRFKNVYLIADDTRTVEAWKKEFAEGKEVEEMEVVTENKKVAPAPTETTNQIQNNNTDTDTDTDIICEDEENNTSKLMENENNFNKHREEAINNLMCKNYLFENLNEISKDIMIHSEMKRLGYVD